MRRSCRQYSGVTILSAALSSLVHGGGGVEDSIIRIPFARELGAVQVPMVVFVATKYVDSDTESSVLQSYWLGQTRAVVLDNDRPRDWDGFKRLVLDAPTSGCHTFTLGYDLSNSDGGMVLANATVCTRQPTETEAGWLLPVESATSIGSVVGVGCSTIEHEDPKGEFAATIVRGVGHRGYFAAGVSVVVDGSLTSGGAEGTIHAELNDVPIEVSKRLWLTNPGFYSLVVRMTLGRSLQHRQLYADGLVCDSKEEEQGIVNSADDCADACFEMDKCAAFAYWGPCNKGRCKLYSDCDTARNASVACVKVFARPKAGSLPPCIETTIQFAVLHPERVFEEVGLPPFLPAAPSVSEGTVQGATLQIVTPHSFPRDLPLPVSILLHDKSGQPVPSIGSISIPSHHSSTGPMSSTYPSDILLKRGHAGFHLNPGWEEQFHVELLGTSVEQSVQAMQQQPSVLVEYEIYDQQSVAAHSFMLLERNLTVHAGAALTIGQGTVLLFEAKLNIILYGALIIHGTSSAPVVLTSARVGEYWGGIMAAGGESFLHATNAIITFSGANKGNRAGFGNGHRREQPAVMARSGATVELVDCTLMDGIGQAIGGKQSSFNMNNTLIQRFLTGGQLTDCSATFHRVCFTDFPNEDMSKYEDGDNDAFYVIGGTIKLHNSFFMFSRDDCIDSGSGPGGDILIDGCWFESCFHEALGLSNQHGFKRIRVVNSVMMNCQQGVELGCSPSETHITVDHCLIMNNFVGVRYGDNNVHCSVDGTLNISNSVIYNNRWDVWNFHHDNWASVSHRLHVSHSLISRALPVNVWSTPDPRLVGMNLFGSAELDGAHRVLAGTLGDGHAADGLPVGLFPSSWSASILPVKAASNTENANSVIESDLDQAESQFWDVTRSEFAEYVRAQIVIQAEVLANSGTSPLRMLVVLGARWSQSWLNDLSLLLPEASELITLSGWTELAQPTPTKCDLAILPDSLVQAAQLDIVLRQLVNWLSIGGRLLVFQNIPSTGPYSLMPLDIVGRWHLLTNGLTSQLVDAGVDGIDVDQRNSKSADDRLLYWVGSRVVHQDWPITYHSNQIKFDKITQVRSDSVKDHVQIVTPANGQCFKDGETVELKLELHLSTTAPVILEVNSRILEIVPPADHLDCYISVQLAGTFQLSNVLWSSVGNKPNNDRVYFWQCSGHERYRDFQPSSLWGSIMSAPNMHTQLQRVTIEVATETELNRGFEVSLGVSGGEKMDAVMKRFGRGSDDHCTRKSWHIQIAKKRPKGSTKAPGLTGVSPDISLDDFMLINMCFDKGYIHYRTALAIATKLGLFPSFHRYVELRMDGVSHGVYLLIQNIVHAVAPLQADTIVQRARPGSLRTYLGVPNEPLDSSGPQQVPHCSDGRLFSHEEVTAGREFLGGSFVWTAELDSPGRKESAAARFFEMLVSSTSNDTGALEATLNVDRYLDFLGLNSLMLNGDYVDEVFFYRDGKQRWSLSGWDFDDVMSICHHSQSFALRDPLLYCAESILDHLITKPWIRLRYIHRLRNLMQNDLSIRSVAAEVKNSVEELRLYLVDEEVAKPMFDSGVQPLARVETASAQLLEMFLMRHRELSVLLSADERLSRAMMPAGSCDTEQSLGSAQIEDEWSSAPLSAICPTATVESNCIGNNGLVAQFESEWTASAVLFNESIIDSSLHRLIAWEVDRHLLLGRSAQLRVEQLSDTELCPDGSVTAPGEYLLTRCHPVSDRCSSRLCEADEFVLQTLVGNRSRAWSDQLNLDPELLSRSEEICLFRGQTAWNLLFLISQPGPTFGQIVAEAILAVVQSSPALSAATEASSSFDPEALAALIDARAATLRRLMQFCMARFGIHQTIAPG